MKKTIIILLFAHGILFSSDYYDSLTGPDASTPGANWKKHAWSQGTGLGIKSNRCVSNESNTDNGSYLNLNFQSDVVVSFRGLSQFSGVGVRCDSTNHSGYYIFLGSASNLYLYKFTNGTFSSLGSINLSGAYSIVDSFTIKCVSDSFWVWWNDSLIIRAEEGTYSSGVVSISEYSGVAGYGFYHLRVDEIVSGPTFGYSSGGVRDTVGDKDTIPLLVNGDYDSVHIVRAPTGTTKRNDTLFLSRSYAYVMNDTISVWKSGSSCDTVVIPDTSVWDTLKISALLKPDGSARSKFSTIALGDTIGVRAAGLRNAKSISTETGLDSISLTDTAFWVRVNSDIGDIGDTIVLSLSDTVAPDTSQDSLIYNATGPAITAQPQPTGVCLGALASFSVTATGTGTLHYQWWRKRSGDSTTVGSDRNGYDTYTWQNGDSVWVVITDDVGSVKSTRVKITNSCIVYRGTTTLSANDTVRAGEDLTLSLKGSTTTGDYNQIFDCSGGNIFVKADSASGFIHNGSGAIKVINSSPTRKVYFTSRNDNAHGIADSNSTGTPARNEKLTPWIRSSGTGVDSLDGIEVWYSGTQLMKFVGTDSTKKVYVKNGRWKNNTLRAVAGTSFIVNDSDNIANLPGKLLVLERDSFDVSDTSGHQHRMVHTQDNCEVRVADCNFEWANTGSYFFVLRVDNWNTTSRRSRVIVKRSSFKQRAYDSLYGAAIRQLKYASTSAIDSIDSCTFDNLYLGILGTDSSLSGSITNNTFSSNDFAINIPASPNLTIDYNTFSCNTKNARIYNDAGDLTIGLNNSYLGNPGPLSYAASPATCSLGVRTYYFTTTNIGGQTDSFTISPALPSGFTFSKTTGAISGRPIDSLDQTDFKVKGYNSCGVDSCTFRLTVSKVLWVTHAGGKSILGYHFKTPICTLTTTSKAITFAGVTDTALATDSILKPGLYRLRNSLGEVTTFTISNQTNQRQGAYRVPAYRAASYRNDGYKRGAYR